MYVRTGSVVALTLAFVTASDSSPIQPVPYFTPAIEIESMGASGGGLTVNATDGWEFSVRTPVTVTSLGVWDHKGDGLNTEIQVGLWDSAGELLAQTTVPAGKAAPEIDDFRYVTIPPVPLRAGENYIVGAAYTPKTKENVGGGSTSSRFFTDGAIRWVQRRRVIRKPGLAFPEPQKNSAINIPMPGGFGPNFLIEKPTTPRRFYRTYRVEEPRKYVLLDLPESADGFHGRDPVVHLSVFAKKDGTLTQILINGEPVGVGEEALQSASSTVRELSAALEKVTGVKPNLRISAPSWARYSDLTKVIQASSSPRVATGARVSPTIRRTSAARIEFSTLRDTQLPLAASGIKGRFIEKGDHVEDSWTGLLWQKNGTASGKKNFQQAADYAASLHLGGLSNWRVPTIEEMATLFPAVDAPFTATPYVKEQCCKPPHEYASYWTSELDTRREDYAWVYHWYAKGGANNCIASANYVYVRAVHDPDSPKATVRQGGGFGGIRAVTPPIRRTPPAGRPSATVRVVKQSSQPRSEREQIVAFIRSNVIGRSISGKVTTAIDHGRIESVFERTTRFTNLLESPNGFGFDEVLQIRERLRPLSKKAKSSFPERKADRTVILRHHYSVRESTGNIVGYVREVSHNPNQLSAAAVVKQGRVSFDDGVLTIRTKTVGYDDHVGAKGMKPAGFKTQAQFSISNGRLRRTQVNEYFEIDPESLKQSPDRKEAELIIEEQI